MDVDGLLEEVVGRGRPRRLRRPDVPRRPRRAVGVGHQGSRPQRDRACWRSRRSARVPRQPAAGPRVAPHPSGLGRHSGGGTADPRRACPAAAPPRLSHLLAADPDNRSLLGWEANESVPPPTARPTTTTRASSPPAPRRSAVDLINPGFKAIHHDEPDDAMECTVLHAQHFQSLIYSTTFNLPSYDEWLLASDWRGAAASPPARVAGAAVGVPGALAAEVTAVRAAARRAARDLSRRAAGRHPPRPGEDRGVDLQPAPVADRHVHRRRPHRVHRRALARHALGAASTGRWTPATASARTRSSTWPTPTSCAIRSPSSARSTSASASSGTRRRRRTSGGSTPTNPQHKYGTHTYSLAEVGVERAPLEARFARYYERYDVPREEAA